MSEQLLSLFGIKSSDVIDDTVPFATLATRTQVLQKLADKRNFDLLILGGGLTGSLVAHEAALQGIRVLLLEQGYFGADALAWNVRISRKLRACPRELFRAWQTFKMLSSQRAPHLVSELPTDSHPVTGLMAAAIRRCVRLVNVDERLLIRESILAARQEGAVALAAVTPVYVEAESAESGCYVVEFEDQLTKQRYQARIGGILIDPSHGILPPSRLGSYVINAPTPRAAGMQWVYEAEPKSAKSGLAFTSFELTDGSFVSVQRKGVATIIVTALSGAIELTPDQCSMAIKEAVREAGWIIKHEVSQRPIAGRWESRYRVAQVRGIFQCSHRGPWDAFASARRIVKTLLEISSERRVMRKTPERLLPGGEQNCEVDAFRALARAQGISEQTIERVVGRWRGRVRYIAQFPNGLRELVPGVLRGEIELAVRSDQVTSIDDLVVGALELQETPSWREAISALKARLEAFAD